MPLDFHDIIGKYHIERVVFQSARARKPAYYAILSISETSFTIDRLAAKEPDPSCSFAKLDAKLRCVAEHGGRCPLDVFDEAVTQQMAYAQSSELAVSLDRSAIVDIRDRSSAIKHFTQALEGLNVNRPLGKPRLYKPISLWCVFDGVGKGELQDNRIPFDWLLPRFTAKGEELGIDATPLVAAEAFFHLTNDLIWMLAYHDPRQFFQDTPTVTMLRERVRHAILKEPLWSLVQDAATRADLMAAIESKWWPGQSKSSMPLAINLKLLKRAVEETIRPFLVDGNGLSTANEGYHHEKILPQTIALLTKESLRFTPTENVRDALSAHKNLLSRYDVIPALDFLSDAEPQEVGAHVTDLLYGDGELRSRLDHFTDLGGAKKESKDRSLGFTVTTISYLLAASQPEKYAFCKPTVYNAAVEALIGPTAVQKDPLSRLCDATALYSQLLALFRDVHHLPFKDLMHVHIAMFVMQTPYHGLPGWEQLMGKKATSKLNGEVAVSDLNVILYGPPGTGKTYRTFSHAVSICDGILPDTREAIVRRFKALREEGRIEVVTFHQSYAYEDFVEAIRPVLESEGDGESSQRGQDVRYECRDGIFKRICDVASTKRVKQSAGGDVENRDVWKMSLGDTQDPNDATIYDECIEKNCVLLGYGGANDFTGCDDRDAIRKKLQASNPSITEHDFSIQAVDAFKNSITVGDLVIISDGNRRFRAIARVTGDYRFLTDRISYRQMRPVEWLAVFENSLAREAIYEKVFSQMTIYRLKKSSLKMDALKDLLAGGSDETKNYVLIIDEINRGNIAKILGELITLLEPDKRIGAPNELQLVLPNSGKHFGVPSNLYILGTMNTADRSIAFLDTALRRRFTFTEMMPDYDVIRQGVGDEGVIDGVDVSHLLASMNRRIELLSDRDHQLGHAYMVHVRSLVDLRRVFLTKIVPLLQEYFYGDWSRICAVLGCSIDSDSGKPIGSNKRPLVRATLLAAENLGGDGEFSNRVRCDVNAEFMQATGNDLAAFFSGVCDPLSET